MCVIVKYATLEDAQRIVDFNRAMAFETEGKDLDLDTVERGVKSVFEDESKGFYVIAAEDGAGAVGCLLVTYEWSDWRNAWFWWIQSVYIRPEYRGQKIYSRLYEFLKREAANHNVCGFRLYAETDNTHAQAVYMRLGMDKPSYVMFEESL
jgi:GNAT superfamily N-acetyltransferase